VTSVPNMTIIPKTKTDTTSSTPPSTYPHFFSSNNSSISTIVTAI
jgi:hypothetical protein